MSENHELSISVLVPTKDRPEALKACLESIASSSYPYKELIVVDSSDDAAVREKNRALAEGLNGRYYYESRKRLAVARNTGLRVSSGDIVVFADDDFVVDQNWLRNLVENYRDLDVVCCTGRMLAYRDDEISRLCERFNSFDKGGERRIFTGKDVRVLELLKAITIVPFSASRSLGARNPVPGSIGAGFCSFRSDIFQEIGYFDEELGRDSQSAWEDCDIYYRILRKTSHKIVYEPAAVVYHNHPQDMEGLLKLSYRNGFTRAIFHSKYLRDGYMLMLFAGSLLFSVIMLLKALFRRDKPFRDIMLADLRGFISGLRQW